MFDLNGAILAAGLGTRLQPLTEQHPKPLLPMGGRPLLEHSLDHLKGLKIQKIGINLHHLGAQIPPALSARDEDLSFLYEAQLQGTGGGIREIAAALPKKPLLVLNGDILFDFPLAPLITQHRASGALGTLALLRLPEDSPFNRVRVDVQGRVHRIAEVLGPEPERGILGGAYTGIQILEPELLAAIPEGPCDILRSAWRQKMNEGAALFGVFVEGFWSDVGTPDRYLEAHLAILRGELLVSHLPPADHLGRRLHPNAWVHPEAEIGPHCVILEGARVGPGARLSESFIDKRAEVQAGAQLQRCLLWSGSQLKGRHQDLISGPEFRVQL